MQEKPGVRVENLISVPLTTIQGSHYESLFTELRCMVVGDSRLIQFVFKVMLSVECLWLVKRNSFL